MSKQRKHITILAVGSRGDVQPYIALGHGLQQAGYAVRLGAPANFTSVAQQYGLEFVTIAPDFKQLMTSPTGRAMMMSGHNIIRLAQTLTRLGNSYAEQTLVATQQACQDTEAIIFNQFCWVGCFLAEKLNLPACAAWIYPLTRTQAFAPMTTPAWLPQTRWTNPLYFSLYEQITHQMFKQTCTMWRRRLDLPPLPWGGLFSYFYQRNIPVLYAYSPHVVPKPADWPDRFVVTGYWFLDRAPAWVPPPALVDFLSSGPPPVYIGFGSISGNRSRDLVEMTVAALKKTGQRGILATGWGGLETDVVNQPLTEDVFVVDNIPHDWLFPQVSAVVHHGGAGTTAAGLRAGVPSILIPFFLDQPFWGQRVATLGVGPKPIPYQKLSVQRLAQAIEVVVGDKAMQRRAAALGERIRAEDGIGRAIEALGRFFLS